MQHNNKSHNITTIVVTIFIRFFQKLYFLSWADFPRNSGKIYFYLTADAIKHIECIIYEKQAYTNGFTNLTAFVHYLVVLININTKECVCSSKSVRTEFIVPAP